MIIKLLTAALVIVSALIQPALAQPDVPVAPVPPSSIELLPDRYSEVKSVQVSPDGNLLAATFLTWQRMPEIKSRVASQPRVCVWDVATGEQKWSFVLEEHAGLTLLFSPDSSRLLLTSLKIVPGQKAVTKAELRDAATGNTILPLQQQDREMISGLIFTPDGKQLVSSSPHYQMPGKANFGFKVWDTVAGGQLHLVENGLLLEELVAFSQNGQKILTRSTERHNGRELKLLLRSWPHLEPLHTIVQKQTQVNKMVFQPEGLYVAVASSFFDDEGKRKGFELYLWNTRNETLEPLEAPNAPVYKVNEFEFSHDGRTLIGIGTALKGGGASGLELWFWDIETGKLKRTLNEGKKFGRNIGGTGLPTKISPDGKSFYHSVNNGQVEMRSLSDGALIRTFEERD